MVCLGKGRVRCSLPKMTNAFPMEVAAYRSPISCRDGGCVCHSWRTWNQETALFHPSFSRSRKAKIAGNKSAGIKSESTCSPVTIFVEHPVCWRPEQDTLIELNSHTYIFQFSVNFWSKRILSTRKIIIKYINLRTKCASSYFFRNQKSVRVIWRYKLAATKHHYNSPWDKVLLSTNS